MGIKLEVISEPFFASQDMNDNNNPTTPKQILSSQNSDAEDENGEPGTTVWICCDVYDTGIGIPGK